MEFKIIIMTQIKNTYQNIHLIKNNIKDHQKPKVNKNIYINDHHYLHYFSLLSISKYILSIHFFYIFSLYDL